MFCDLDGVAQLGLVQFRCVHGQVIHSWAVANGLVGQVVPVMDLFGTALFPRSLHAPAHTCTRGCAHAHVHDVRKATPIHPPEDSGATRCHHETGDSIHRSANSPHATPKTCACTSRPLGGSCPLCLADGELSDSTPFEGLDIAVRPFCAATAPRPSTTVYAKVLNRALQHLEKQVGSLPKSFAVPPFP